MMSLNHEAPERQDIEALLPWHAAGTLSRRDSDRVERALASDRELARRYQLVREELNETIHLNESLGAPSARCMEKLFAAIDAEAPAARKKASFNFVGRLVEFMSGFSARKMAYVASAAVVVLLLQSAVLTTLMMQNQGVPSAPTLQNADGEQLLMIRFAPQATLADVTRFLDVHRATVVNGPRRDGFYEVRISTTRLPEDEIMRRMQRMRADGRIVAFVAVKNP